MLITFVLIDFEIQPFTYLEYVINEDNLNQMKVLVLALSNSSRHAKTFLRAYADGEGPGQPANPHRLIRTFAVR